MAGVLRFIGLVYIVACGVISGTALPMAPILAPSVSLVSGIVMGPPNPLDVI